MTSETGESLVYLVTLELHFVRNYAEFYLYYGTIPHTCHELEHEALSYTDWWYSHLQWLHKINFFALCYSTSLSWGFCVTQGIVSPIQEWFLLSYRTISVLYQMLMDILHAKGYQYALVFRPYSWLSGKGAGKQKIQLDCRVFSQVHIVNGLEFWYSQQFMQPVETPV